MGKTYDASIGKVYNIKFLHFFFGKDNNKLTLEDIGWFTAYSGEAGQNKFHELQLVRTGRSITGWSTHSLVLINIKI